MNVAIDTSWLKRNKKLDSSDILFLKKLSKLGLIKFHIIWIVFKEATSQNFIEISTRINKIIKELDNLDKQGIHEIEHQKFKNFAREIEKINISESVLKHWEEFIKNSKAIFHNIKEKHGEIVMNSYFNGDLPFPEPKSRKDIPDAFIFQALVSISQEYGKIHFISDDNNLRKSCENVKDIVACKKYLDFFNLPEFVNIKTQYSKIEKYADELIIIEDHVERIKNQINNDVLYDILDDIIITSPNIPDDNHEGRLNDIIEINLIDINKSNIHFVDNFFYIPVNINAIFNIEYFLYKSDYYFYNEKRNINITDLDWNDHYLLVEELFEVKFSFKYKISKENVQSFEFEIEDINIHEVSISDFKF